MQKKKLKNPLPKNLNIVMAFDVSTSSTGFCLLLNGRPATYQNGSISIGQVHMREEEEYQGFKSVKDRTKITKKRDIKYTNYGDQMFHGSHNAIQTIKSAVYNFVKPIQNIITEMTKNKEKNIPVVKSFQIIYEISEIPNFSRFHNFQSLTSVRKLALYVGAVEEGVSSVIHNGAYNFFHKVQCKFIKPTEWQMRTFAPQGDREKTKLKSVEIANEKLKGWGLKTIPREMDDMADAINIAMVASAVRDNVFARAQAKKKIQQKNITINRDILKEEQVITRLERLAFAKKEVFLEKIRKAKKSKFNLEDEKLKEPKHFLNSADYERLASAYNKSQQLKIQLKDMRKERVIKNETPF